MDMQELTPGPTQRGLIVGLAGGGKSFLAKHLLWEKAKQSQVLIVDPKREFDFPGAVVFDNPRKLVELLKSNKGKTGVFTFRPKVEDFDNISAYELIFKTCFERGSICVFIDELTAFCTSTQYPKHLRHCYNIGRSRGCSMLGCTQRPTNIPPWTISEANRFYIFPLNLPDDVKKVKGFVKGYNPNDFDEEYSFYHYDATKPKSIAKLHVLAQE